MQAASSGLPTRRREQRWSRGAGLRRATGRLLAPLCRPLPRSAWTSLVSPATLVRWHRELVPRLDVPRPNGWAS